MLARIFLAVSLYAISAQSALAVDQFSFAPVTGAPFGLVFYSNRVVISGLTGPTPISIVGGSYRIGSLPFTNAPGTVNNFQTVQVGAGAAWRPGATRKATLTIGDLSVDFSITSRFLAPAPASALYLISPPGEFIGNESTRLINFGPENPGSSLQVNNHAGGRITVSMTEPPPNMSGGTLWFLELDAPGDGPVVVGSYEGAVRSGSNGSGPGLNFSGDGRACNSLTGRFDVFDVAYAGDGSVQRLAVNFQQYCDGSAHVLWGEMRVNSTLRVGGGGAWAPKDLSGDGFSDILWRNVSTGENYAYVMAGLEIFNEGYLRTVADLNWEIAGVGAFDGDGRADILWRNKSTGENYIYAMIGTSIVAEGYIRTVADQNWIVAGIGDFDGDGRDDILWRNSASGDTYVYLMNDLAILSEGYVRTVADAAWEIKGVGDFDRDGRSDILWRNRTSGENYIFFMNGVSIVNEGYLRTVADTNWEIKGVGDFDRDGRADILWRNSSSGENYIYLMDGTNIVGEGYVRTVADMTWQIVAVGDYDGDGRSDLLWRNGSSGLNYVFPMDGIAIKPSEGYVRSVTDQNWQPQR